MRNMREISGAQSLRATGPRQHNDEMTNLTPTRTTYLFEASSSPVTVVAVTPEEACERVIRARYVGAFGSPEFLGSVEGLK